VKVTVIGAGNVGATTAMRLAQGDVCGEVVLVDVVPGLAEGLALDLGQSAPIEGFTTRVTGTTDYGPSANSDVVVMTAGRPRAPGESRADLLRTNAAIVRSCVGAAAAASPFAVLVVVTNPLDEMTYLAHRVSGFPAERVVGMAGDLDSARLRFFLAGLAGVAPARVDAMTLGSHGETMVPLPARATIEGTPASAILDAAALDAVFERTRNGGAEIVGLLRRGSAFYAPSAATAAMVRAIVEDRRELHPACAYLRGEYGIRDAFVGVPAVLSRRGVEEVRELDLDPRELRALQEAAAAVARRCRELDDVLAGG
jgi:malate dehydrogenase